MEAHLIRPAHFTGITCTAYQRRDVSAGSLTMEMTESAHDPVLRFRCSTGSHNTSLNNFPLKVRHALVFHSCFVLAVTHLKGKLVSVCTVSFLQNSVAVASVTIPATLFPPDAPADCKLQFVAFRSGSLFPVSANSSSSGEHSRRRTVNTPVLFVGLGKEMSHML